MKRTFFLKNTFLVLLLTLLSLKASAQEDVSVPVAELMEGAIPEGAKAIDKKNGYALEETMGAEHAYSEEDTPGEYYTLNNMVISFNGGKSGEPYKEGSLKKTWAALEEMAGRDTARVKTDDDENIVKKINNYEVLKSYARPSSTFFYYLIGPDRVSYLNFTIVAKSEDIEKAKALGDSMLNSMKFK